MRSTGTGEKSIFEQSACTFIPTGFQLRSLNAKSVVRSASGAEGCDNCVSASQSCCVRHVSPTEMSLRPRTKLTISETASRVSLSGMTDIFVEYSIAMLFDHEGPYSLGMTLMRN